MEYQLDDIVSKIDRLPVPNSVALEVIHLCSEPEIAVSQLVQVISTDQSLTTQILRIANSSFFNYPKTIYSVDRAIMILGFNLLRDVALSIAIYSFYKGFDGKTQFDFQYQWRHSLYAAIVGKALALRYDPENDGVYYVSGLLHDLGKLVESLILGQDYEFLVEKSRQEGLRLDQIERKFFGFHHGETGALLLQNWNLPDAVISMVCHHHYPAEYVGGSDLIRQVRMTYLGNILAHFVQDELKEYQAILQLDPEFLQHFSFTAEEFSELISFVRKVIDKNQHFFEIQKF